MVYTFHDLSKLSKAMVFPKAAPKVVPPKTPPPPNNSAEKRAAQDVLAYFGLDSKSPAPKPEPTSHDAQKQQADEHAWQKKCAALEARITELESALNAMHLEGDTLRNELAAAQKKAQDAAAKQRAAEENLQSCAPSPVLPQVPSPPPPITPVVHSDLSTPKDFQEVFPGEFRELILAVLLDACEGAKQSKRDRRVSAINAFLSCHHSTGELESRRVQVRRFLQESGPARDIRFLTSLEKLGFRLISGKKHWKLEYGDIRFPLAKTPSDYRANLNTLTEISTRCF